MGFLGAILNLDDDTVRYSFIPAGHQAPLNLSIGRDFGRRESVQVIPGMDGVLDGYGRNPGPMDRRDQPFSFRVISADGNLDAAYDTLAAAIAPGDPVRLQYVTDAGGLWYTVGSNPRIQHTLTAANSWGNGGYCDFTVTWRIRPDWRPRFSQASDVWGVADGVWGTSDGLWGAAFFTTLAANPTSFTVDMTGTAGYDLPTIPDTGPVITIDGPAGGSAGLVLQNVTTGATVRDTAGVLQWYGFIIPQLPAGSQAVLDCARQRFTLNGAPFRPTKGPYQPATMIVVPGVVNTFVVTGIGTGILTGGAILLDCWKKRA